MPTPLGEGMTGSRTNPALPQRNLHYHGTITAWRRPTTTQVAPPFFRHPPTACTGPAQRQDRSSSLRCGRSVLTPVLTRCCLHGGRKPAKPLVNNQLTKPRPFRDDTSDRQRRLPGYEEAGVPPLRGELTTVLTTMTTVRLPDTFSYTTTELLSCLVVTSACADGSEGSSSASRRCNPFRIRSRRKTHRI
jgi:hypothetical protein